MRIIYRLLGVLGIIVATAAPLQAQPKLSDLSCRTWLQVRGESPLKKAHAELREAAIRAAATLGPLGSLTDVQLLSLVDERCDRYESMSVQNAIQDVVRLASEAKVPSSATREPSRATSDGVDKGVSEGDGKGEAALLIVVFLVVVGVLAVLGDAANKGKEQPKKQDSAPQSPAWNVKVRISLVVLVIVLPFYFMVTEDDDRRFFLMNVARYGAPLIIGGLVGLVASFVLWRRKIAGKIALYVALCGFGITAVSGGYADMTKWNATAIGVFWSSLVAWAMVCWALWNVATAVYALWPSTAAQVPVRPTEIDKEQKP